MNSITNNTSNLTPYANRCKNLLLVMILAFSGTLVAQERPTFTQFEAYSALLAGRAQYEQGDYLVALRNFDRVVQLNKEFPEVNYSEVYLDRGNTLFALGRYDEAIADYAAGIDQSTRKVLTNRVADSGYDDRSDNQQSVRIIDLDRNLDMEREHALLYHNRGVALYYKGQYKEASEDFEVAVSISPELAEARRNLENARLASGRNRFYEDLAPVNARVSAPQTTNDGKSGGIFQRIFRRNQEEPSRVEPPQYSVYRGEPAVSPRYPRARYYAEPQVAGQSFDYIKIESVEINAQSTLVNMRVSNLTREPFPVRLFNPGEPSAFFITDRTRTRTYRLKSIQGLPRHPQSVELKPRESLSFTLEFEALPEGVGFVHILEGNTQQGKEWNFYDVRLD